MRSTRRLALALGAVFLLAPACASSGTSGSSTASSAGSAATATTAAGATDASVGAATTASDSSATTAAGGSTSATGAATDADDTTPAIVAAAEAFLATLSDSERAAVTFDFTDDAQRQRWSNLPEGLYTRQGLMWGDLGDESKAAWLALMQVTLSPEGYERVLAQWTADDELASGGSGGGMSLSYGMQYYWVAVIGTPSTADAWQWQWGGHHVTVNATVSGSEVSLTPSFIGVQPGTYDADGVEVRPLGDIEDEAFALVNSLDDAQQAEAVLGDTLIDLVLGPGEDGRTIEAEGLSGADMTEGQRAALLQLIGEYGGLVNAEDAAARMAELEAELDETFFAWYGPTTEGSGIYFRITGPSIVVEYSGQSMGGDASDHIHGVYRDPSNEYGAAIGAGLGS